MSDFAGIGSEYGKNSTIVRESSFWINKNQLTQEKFSWQDEYFVVSVSESNVDAVREYIKNQEKHHRKKGFEDEYREFLILNGLKPVPIEIYTFFIKKIYILLDVTIVFVMPFYNEAQHIQ